jgi:hypothetical protein
VENDYVNQLPPAVNGGIREKDSIAFLNWDETTDGPPSRMDAFLAGIDYGRSNTSGMTDDERVALAESFRNAPGEIIRDDNGSACRWHVGR